MRFKKRPQLPGAGRTRAGHHHRSHTPTSPGTILLGKMAYHTKQIRRKCMYNDFACTRFGNFVVAIIVKSNITTKAKVCPDCIEFKNVILWDFLTP